MSRLGRLVLVRRARDKECRRRRKKGEIWYTFIVMKTGVHPNYVVSQVSCACGASFTTRSTKPVIKLEICSSCHPFYTGRRCQRDRRPRRPVQEALRADTGPDGRSQEGRDQGQEARGYHFPQEDSLDYADDEEDR